MSATNVSILLGQLRLLVGTSHCAQSFATRQAVEAMTDKEREDSQELCRKAGEYLASVSSDLAGETTFKNYERIHLGAGEVLEVRRMRVEQAAALNTSLVTGGSHQRWVAQGERLRELHEKFVDGMRTAPVQPGIYPGERIDP